MAKIHRDPDALKKLIAEYSAWWHQDVEKAIDLLYKELEKGTGIDKALKAVAKKYPEVFNLPDMEDTLVQAAAHGYGIVPSVLSSSDKEKIGKELTKAWSGEKLSLSQKIHGSTEKMRRAITTTIKQQMKQNSTWITAARVLYDGYGYGKVIKHQQIADYMRLVRKASGAAEIMSASRKALYNINRLAQSGAPNQALKAAYLQLIEAAQKGSREALKKAVRTAIAEKSRYVAERLVRTEAAKAWADGFFARTLFDDDVIAYRWKLSSRHPVFDICDMYAKANMFGLGAGVYPKDKVPPLPAHPHCMCRLVEVFRTEIDMSLEHDNIRAEGDKWLKTLSVDKQEAVLGIAGREAWLKGEDWRDYMRGWEGLIAPVSRLSVNVIADILKEKGVSSSDEIADLITIGMLDPEKYKDIIAVATSEVILTKKQLEHINIRHPGAYEKYKNILNILVADPDYILEDPKHENTAMAIKKIDDFAIAIIKLASGDTKKKNSIITLWEMKEKRLDRYLKKHKTIYKKE